MLAFYFYIIGGTSENYLTPALAKMADFFKMSENLAGVTLLAFGNGSADVIGSIAASGLGSDGIYLSCSGLIGAAMVNSFFLNPMVVLVSKTAISLRPEAFGRDVIILIIVQGILISYFIAGTIYWYMAAVFPFIYIIYVLICFVQEHRLKAANAAAEEQNKEKALQIFEQDLAYEQTKAECVGEEIVRREGESFVKYSSIDINSLLDTHVEQPDNKADQKAQVIKVSSAVAQHIRNRLWMHVTSVAITMYFQ